VSGLLFGALAAIYAGRLHTFGTRSSNDTRNLRLAREALVAAQVTLTVVLLTASISVGRAFANLMHIDRGFDRRGVVTVSVSLDGTTHQDDARRRVYFEEALARVRRLPGVRSSSATEFLPLYAIGFIGGRFKLDSRSAATFSMVVPVMAEYFRTMGGRILAGREFTEAEVQGNAKVAIVDEVFSNEFGPPADVVGREIENGGNRRTIVGVVKAMDYMTDGANASQIFVPSQSPGGFFSAFVARLSGRPEDHLAMIRDAIRSVDPQVPVFGEKTMDQRMAEVLSRPQFYRTALLCFAAFALLLAIIGIYGIVSYAVARRTHEMGIRMAVGITPAKLRRSLLRQGLMPIAVGAIPGIVVAILSGRLLESLVSGAKSVNLEAYAATVFFIAWVAAMGIWMATRPIARLDIVEVLRAE
jgi:predicted permease